jgi:hypothetical protein
MQIKVGDKMEVTNPQTNGSSHMDAWAAGFMEGRGMLHKGRVPEVFVPCVELTARDSRITDALLAHYGGSVRLEALRNNPIAPVQGFIGLPRVPGGARPGLSVLCLNPPGDGSRGRPGRR